MPHGKFILPKNHKPFMKVAKGGSNCSNCKFLTSDKKHCGNTYFVKWYGTDLLPTPVSRFCSDWYIPSPEYLAAGGKITPSDKGKPIAPINPERLAKKREHAEQLANSIRSLRSQVTKDLKSSDEKVRLTALVVAVIDKTAERVGNEDSADRGHLGVTGFRKKNITVIGDKVHLRYVGKSGVSHEKSFSDKLVASVLKKAIKDSPNRGVFVTSDGFRIKADRVNRYLSEYNISAKDLRGYHANKYIIDKLNKQEIPQEIKDRKVVFKKALRYSAKRVGHAPLTLQKHYLFPELQTSYVNDGVVIDMKDFYSGGGPVKNSTTSKLTPLQQKLVRTKEFKEWFGDWESNPEKSSKVVDENGEPLVVYHGTNSELFTEFDVNKLGEGVDQYGSGFYFSNARHVSEGYGNNIFEVFLNIRNPIDQNRRLKTSEIKKIILKSPNLKDSLYNFGDVDYEGQDKVLTSAVNGYVDYGDTLIQTLNAISNDFFNGGESVFLETIKSVLGYDGNIDTTYPEHIYVVFFPNQIKLADGTNKKFDKDSNDIRFGSGGAIKTDSGEVVGPSHADGGVPMVVEPSGVPIEVEGKEYYLCAGALEDKNVYEFHDVTNKEVLDAIFQFEGCKYNPKIAHDNDFIVCKLSTQDKKVRDYKGTISSILNSMQSEYGCRLTSGNKFLFGGSIGAERVYKPNTFIDLKGNVNFEIPDNNCEVFVDKLPASGGQFVRLSTIFGHPELFRIYPGTKDIKVWVFQKKDSPYQDYDSKIIFEFGYEAGDKKNSRKYNLQIITDHDLSTIQGTEQGSDIYNLLRRGFIAELQHAIQLLEWGRTERGRRYYNEAVLRSLQQIRNKIRGLADDEVELLKDEYEYKFILDNADHIALQLYLSDYYEIQSRLSVKRILLTSEERIKLRPYRIIRKDTIPDSLSGNMSIGGEVGDDYIERLRERSFRKIIPLPDSLKKI